MRVVGLDIHRVFAEAVMLEDGTVRRLGRIGMTRDHLAAFARTLTHDDHVVVEATGNASAVAEVIRPHVGRVVIANPRQVQAHRRGADQDGRDRRDRSGPALCQRLPAGGLGPGRAHAWPAAAGDAAHADRAPAGAAEDDRPIDPARPPRAAVPACRPVRAEGASMAAGAASPADEGDAVARHLREHDRLSEDLRVVERELARDALADPNVKRLMTIPGIDMVVAVGLMAAIGPIERFAGPDRAGRLSRPEPERASVRRGPAAARADHQAGPHPCPDHAGRGGLAGGARTRAAARLLPARRTAAAEPTSRPWRSRASWRSSSGTCCTTRRGLRLGAAGAARQEAARPGASLGRAGAPRPAGRSLRLQSDPDAPGRDASRRAG